MARLVQDAGRILQPFPGKATAEIHDYHDTYGCRKPVLPVQMRPLDAGDSVPCPARGWRVLASPDVR